MFSWSVNRDNQYRQAFGKTMINEAAQIRPVPNLLHSTNFWHGFRLLQNRIITRKMNKEYSVKEKLTLFLLASGVVCFGIVFPDSLSTHVKMVHYAAHFGMSFLIALCFYMICTVKMRLPKIFSYSVLIFATLLIGAIYKYWEISTQGMIGNYSFHTIIDVTGTMTSMSQNLSGLMGAMLLIEGILERNLVLSVLKSDTLHISKNGNMRVVGPVNHSKPLGTMQVVKHFSTAAEN
jgi:hypothetical protein